jgi:hypothetical protein
MWIDIEDRAGNRLGAGPIVTATGWTHTRRLDQAGTFSFQMPVSDARSALAQVKRVARCWTVENGTTRELGAGIIERRQLTVKADGATLLEVSGADLLRELAYRNVGELNLFTTCREHPAGVMLLTVDPPATLSEAAWTDGAVGDTATAATVPSLDAGGAQFLYVSAGRQFNKLHFVLSSGQSVVTDLHVQYFDAESAGWNDVTIVEDTTAVGGAPLAQSGYLTWDAPVGWITETTTDTPVYDIRIFPDATLGDVGLADVSIAYDAPTETALSTLMALAPSGWSLDTVAGYAETQPAQEIGANRVANGDFAAYTGTLDDGNSDTFTAWTNADVDDPNGDTVEAVAGGSGAVWLKISTGGTTGARPSVGQALTVTPGTDYLLTFWNKGDGSGGAGAWRLYDEAGGTALSALTETGNATTTWTPARIRFTAPANRTTVYLRLWGPAADDPGAAWFHTVSVKQRLGGEVYLTLNGETVLEALNRLSEQTGEHFILGSGRQVRWLRSDATATGVRLTTGGALAGADDARTAWLVSLDEVLDAYDLVSRVYPLGGGTGQNRVDLTHCTRPAPDGYTLDLTAGYLERDAAVTALGRIDYRLDFPDINAAAPDATQLAFAANSLLERAYVWLKRHSATSTDPLTGDAPRAYRATVVKLLQAVLPGYTVHLAYREVCAGVVTVQIAQDVCVLSSTVQVDGRGVRTVALELGTVDQPLGSDTELLAYILRQQRASRAQTPANEHYSSSGAGVIVGAGVRNGRVTGVVRRLGITEDVPATATLQVRNGVVTGYTT